MFTHIKEFSKFLMLAGFVSMMTACEQVQSEVVSFSSLAPQAPGGAYYVLPSQEQASSVEFLQYSQSIGRRLSKKGWYQVVNESEAKFIVLLDYGVAGSTSKTGSIPIYGQTGGGTTNHSGTYNTSYGGFGTYSGTSYTMPTWGVVGSSAYSVTHHQRYFQLKIIDKTNDVPVYETKAASEGSAANFGTVAECIFDMALRDFPLQTSTKEIVYLDDCGK